MRDFVPGARTIDERVCDQLLVTRAQAGDRRAFESLVVKYQARLMRFSAQLVHNLADAEDVVQETFLRAYRGLMDYRGECGFYTWLYRHGVNVVNTLPRSSRTPPADEFRPAGGPRTTEVFGSEVQDISTPEALLSCRQIAVRISAAIDLLPLELRTALVLREIEGFDYRNIAHVLQCPIPTVRSRIFRAREMIADQVRSLVPEGVTLPI
jgi:RNA polymerase sigma-70 factor (ECF subfamily)